MSGLLKPYSSKNITVKFTDADKRESDSPTKSMLKDAMEQVSNAHPLPPREAQKWMDRIKDADKPERLGDCIDTLPREAKADILFDKLAGRQKGHMEYPGDVEEIQADLLSRGAHMLGTGSITMPKNGRLNILIPDGVLVKAQNVHDFYMGHSSEEKFYDPNNIFCAKMPYDRMVISYDHTFFSTKTGLEPKVRHVNVVLSKATSVDFLTSVAMANLSLADGEVLAHIADRRQPDSFIKAYIAMDGFAYPGIWYVMIDETGHVLTDEVHGQWWLWIRNGEQTQQLAEIQERTKNIHAPGGVEAEDAFARHGMIALTTIQFMNCKNVEIADNGPSRQQRRHAERTGTKPPVTYKTLVIHPMGHKRQSIRNSDGTISAKALHIVRGHFKDFRFGPGLGRGHARGVFWWDAMVRGSAEHGRIEKDYSVNP